MNSVGAEVATGNINVDGIDDLIMGASGASYSYYGTVYKNTGFVYLIASHSEELAFLHTPDMVKVGNAHTYTVANAAHNSNVNLFYSLNVGSFVEHGVIGHDGDFMWFMDLFRQKRGPL